MYGYIYKITNVLNSKVYVGKHKYPKAEIDPKYWASGVLINRALKLHGEANFTRKLLATADSKEELNLLESYWISNLDCRAPRGYNLTDGGDGAPNLDEETRYRMGRGHRGIPRSEELKQRTSQTLKGRPHSEEWVAKIAASLAGRKPAKSTVEGNKKRKRNSRWINNGIEEHMLQFGSSIPEGYMEGRLRNPFPNQRGIPKSSEIVEKISAKKKGSRWHNNGEIEIMLQSGQEVPEGFSPGRLKKC